MSDPPSWTKLPADIAVIADEILDGFEDALQANVGVDVQSALDQFVSRLGRPIGEKERHAFLYQAMLLKLDLTSEIGDRNNTQKELNNQFPNDRHVIDRANADISTIISVSTQPAEIAVPDVSRYPLVKDTPIGRGSFATIWLAEDPRLRRRVVLKVLHGHWLDNPEVRTQFEQESTALAKIDHANIRRVLDYLNGPNGEPIQVLEFVDGSSLKDLLTARPAEKVAWKTVHNFASRLAGALATAHANGIFHRDLKPSNILLQDGELTRPKVTDFGLAMTRDNRRSHAGEFAGTLRYMSPEQLRREADKVDGRSDIWAFGVILYELLAGFHPFEETGFDGIEYHILNDDPVPIRQQRRDLPLGVHDLFENCLAKSMRDRFASMSDVEETLAQISSTSKTGDATASPSVVVNVSPGSSVNIHSESPHEVRIESLLPDVPPKPTEIKAFSTVRFRRSARFWGRDEDITRVDRLIEQDRMAALTGIQGSGKTLTAAMIASDPERDYRYRIWISAESENSIIRDLVAIASKIYAPIQEQPEETAKGVLRRLGELEGWFVVYDNVDDFEVVSRYLPPDPMAGDVLLTTIQHRDVGYLEGRCRPVRLTGFSELVGAEFLLRRTGRADFADTNERRLAEEISVELGGLPLALEQAGAYMADDAIFRGFQNYLDRFREFSKDLLHHGGGAVTEHQSVAATFLLAFDRLSERSPEAANLVKLCSVLAPEDIPESVLLSAPESVQRTLKLENQKCLDTALRDAGRLSLIQQSATGNAIDIHRIVQLVVRSQMANENRKRWVKLAIETVAGPNLTKRDTSSGNWPEHINTVIRGAQREGVRSASLASIMLEAAEQTSSPEKALQLANSGFELCEEFDGKDSRNSASYLQRLANLNMKFGHYSVSEACLRRALIILKSIYGSESSEAAECSEQLGSALQMLGRDKDAEVLHEQAFNIWSQLYHPDDIRFAECLFIAGAAAWLRGAHDQGLSFYKDALSVFERNGEEHSSRYWDIKLELAEATGLNGDTAEAEEHVSEWFVEKSSHAFADEHPNSHQLTKCASILFQIGKFATARAVYTLVLEIYDRKSNEASVEYSSITQNLGVCCFHLEDYINGEKFFRQTILNRQRYLNYRCMKSTKLLGVCLLKQNRFSEAEVCLKEAVQLSSVANSSPSYAKDRDLQKADSLTRLCEVYEHWSRKQIAKKDWLEAKPIIERWIKVINRMPITDRNSEKTRARQRLDTVSSHIQTERQKKKNRDLHSVRKEARKKEKLKKKHGKRR